MRLYIYNGQVTNYSITTTGELYNNKTKKWLKGQIAKNGYKTFYISIDGEKKRLYAHRMVAETYLPIISNKTQVNHKDGNKINNDVSNLEWITPIENIHHARANGLWENKQTKVYCYDKYKKLVCIYPSIATACQINHYNPSWMYEQLSREEKTLSHGFYWLTEEKNDFPTKETGGIKKPIGQYNSEGLLVAKYESRNECARILGYDKKRIGECCNGKIKTYRGYVFKYLIEDIV